MPSDTHPPSVRSQIRSVRFRTFCHASEVPERVEAALRALFPTIPFKATLLEGHHGQRLLLYEGRSQAQQLGEQLLAALSADDRSRLRRELSERTDEEGTFHLRLDKQEAYRGSCTLSRGGDAIDVQLLPAAYPRTRQTALEVLSRCLEESSGSARGSHATAK